MKSIAPALLYALLTCTSAANAATAPADGLAPCESGDSYKVQVDTAIDQAPGGKGVIGFTAYPSFHTEWGIRILQNARNEPILRVVQFNNSVWASAYHEHPKGTFRRHPSRANLKRSVDDIAISRQLLTQLRNIVDSEVSLANESNRAFGLDGEAYHFRSGGNACGTTWSPDAGSRMGKLVAVFDALRALAHTPTSVLRSYREEKIVSQLRELMPSK